MAQNVSVIGVQPEELPWVRLLISLLRHPDSSIPELTRQALQYVARTSAKSGIDAPEREASGRVREIL